MLLDMTIIDLKYGKGHFEVDVPDRNLAGILLPKELEGVKDEQAEIRRALENPIGYPRLRDKLKKGMKVVVIISDVTRPCPSYKFLPILLDEINAGGVPDEDVTAVVAIGSHRHTSEEEKKALMGVSYGRVRCIDDDPGDCKCIGTSSFGHRIDIFREIVDADFVVCTGNTEYHYFAGYSGGVKAILPGCASHNTIEVNHAMMVSPKAETGRLDSPIRQEIDEVPGMMKNVGFLLDVVLNSKKEIVAALAGDIMRAHREGVKFVDRMYSVKVPKADIVITSAGGYPKDINMYQAQKAMDNCKHAVRDGGSMILVAQCQECLGNDVFACWVDEATTIEAQARRMDEHFELGGHKASVIAKTAMKCEIYLVSEIPEDKVRKMFLIRAKTPQEALDACLAKYGPDAKVLVSPFGGMVLPKPAE
jgi:lactate racemase